MEHKGLVCFGEELEEGQIFRRGTVGYAELWEAELVQELWCPVWFISVMGWVLLVAWKEKKRKGVRTSELELWSC